MDKEIVAKQPLSRGRTVAIIATCTMVMWVNSSNLTSAAVSLPSIGRDLGIEQNQLEWLVSSYALSSGCLFPLLGRVADLYGRKITFLLGSAWLAIFTLACGFAHDAIVLDVLRGLQGIGVAAALPASMGILAHSFPPGRTRSIAFATFAAGAPLGGFTGQALGGTLIQLSHPSWRSNFYLSSGLTVLFLLMGLFSIPRDEPSTEADRRIDWLGAFLVTAALVLIIFVLSDGEIAPNKWATSYIIALLILGVLILGVFLVWEWYLERVQLDPNAPYSMWTPPPMMKLSLWTKANGKFAAIMLMILLTFASFLAWNFWSQLFYQDYEDYTPILTMLRFIPMFVTGVILNTIVVLVIARVPIVWLLAIGTLATGCASLFFALIQPNATYWRFGFPSAILSVFGADFVFASGTIFVAQIVEPHEQSLSGALFQTMNQVGTALGVTVTTIIYNRVVAQSSAKMGIIVDTSNSNAPREALLHGYKAAAWGSFAFGVVGTIFAVLFFWNVGVVADHGQPESDAINSAPSSGSQTMPTSAIDLEKGVSASRLITRTPSIESRA